MKSGKQRRLELDARKKARLAKSMTVKKVAARTTLEQEQLRGVQVNREALAAHNSYNEPDFVNRGFYSDQPFQCVDCGKSEVWTAGQQKWWYEVAKGDVFTTVRRCRPCRSRESQRRTEARRIHLEGLARKR
ncbi:MAG TPA: zinc-ribbon domain containing protein [Gemmatales bacterium]|nr:zinc-ribbon domain containing protein [Gemmatales bacterium]